MATIQQNLTAPLSLSASLETVPTRTPLDFEAAAARRRALNRAMVAAGAGQRHTPDLDDDNATPAAPPPPAVNKQGAGLTPEQRAQRALLGLRLLCPSDVVDQLAPDDGLGKDPLDLARRRQDRRGFRRAAPKRERLLDLVAAGAQRREMAAVLACAPNTVRNSLVAAYAWLGAETGQRITTRDGAAHAWRVHCLASGHRLSDADRDALDAYRADATARRLAACVNHQDQDEGDEYAYEREQERA